LNTERLLVVIGLIMVGLLSRFLPHPPNFTAMSALALFSGIQLRSQKLALVVVFIAMLLSDLALGLHNLLPLVYGCFALTVFLGSHFCNTKTSQRAPFVLITSTLLFFFVTNFGIWALGDLYPKTVSGLGLCYAAALPFLGNQLMGDLFYGASLFGSMWIAERFFPNIGLSGVTSR
jgi:hypothetical protein